MKKPILFNTEMLKAILEGRKTSTRRPVKRTPSNDEPSGYGFWKEHNERDNRWYIKDYTHSCIWWTLEEYISRFSKYHVGDILWVRETWAVCEALALCSPNKIDIDHQKKVALVWYKADGQQNIKENMAIGEKMISRGKWRPSIHMPKAAARLFLKVTDIKIERLQDISEDGAIKEGFEEVPEVFTAKELFQATWNSIYKNWNENPYVWVIEFERVEE